MIQNHLNYTDRINLWSYYTNIEHVQIVWDMIEKYINSEIIILDSSCGYWNFLQNNFWYRQIGGDIDSKALEIAKQKHPNHKFYNENALYQTWRQKYWIWENEKICIIGNPPYNDTTSIIRSNIKKEICPIDEDIKTRDLWMSFMLSYNKLQADYVCILHPLSYLIKKSNFGLLKNFTKNYKLIENKIISSGVFAQASKSMQFPIVIWLYQRDNIWMSYDYILDYEFQTIDWNKFKIWDFDYIDNYISKYPNKWIKNIDNNSILFWTMRDINALKRNRTFVNEFGPNTIVVDNKKLDYYVYVDVFKQRTDKIPYYFGNMNVMINNDLFEKNKKHFLINCISRNKFLWKYYDLEYSKEEEIEWKKNINNYFFTLLKNHYVYQ